MLLAVTSCENAVITFQMWPKCSQQSHLRYILWLHSKCNQIVSGGNIWVSSQSIFYPSFSNIIPSFSHHFSTRHKTRSQNAIHCTWMSIHRTTNTRSTTSPIPTLWFQAPNWNSWCYWGIPPAPWPPCSVSSRRVFFRGSALDFGWTTQLRTHIPPLRWKQHLSHSMKMKRHFSFLQMTHIHPGQLSHYGPLHNLLKKLKSLLKLLSTTDHLHWVFLL